MAKIVIMYIIISSYMNLCIIADCRLDHLVKLIKKNQSGKNGRP